MPNQTKKLAAALAAVEQYLAQEAAEATELAAQSAALVAANTSAVLPRSEPGAWAQSGFVDMMAGRRLIQLRAFANRR
jgi:hypothetical protein